VKASPVQTLTTEVIDSFKNTPNARLRQILTALIPALHRVIAELQVTSEEWEYTIGFLTEVGQTCTDVRQEFVLLSDVLGISMLVETINDIEHGNVTDSTVLGPFHMTESPPRAFGDTIDLVGAGEPCVVEGRVLSRDGSPLSGAQVDVWQADEDGFYDVQVPETQPPGNGRGLFTTDDNGRFRFQTVVPAPYPIPTDGPVGRLLAATKRHPYRPAHIHFIVSAPSHRKLVTHIFIGGSPYLDSDAVFAVKESLIVDVAEIDDPARAQSFGLSAPFRYVPIDLTVMPTELQSVLGDRHSETAL